MAVVSNLLAHMTLVGSVGPPVVMEQSWSNSTVVNVVTKCSV